MSGLKRSSGRGRGVALAVGGVLFAVVAGGVGTTAVVVDRAHRAPGAPDWVLPPSSQKADADKAGAAAGAPGTGTGKAPSELGRMLVPLGTDGYSRGPDIEGFGAEADLTGAQAVALRKDSLRTLPSAQRRKVEREIDREHIKGMAMRSYVSTDDAPVSTVSAESAFTVEIVLSRMENTRAVRGLFEFQTTLFDSVDLLRKGPEVKGHKDARCFLGPDEKDEKLDMMTCSAYRGEILVSVVAEGPKPLNAKGVALLLSAQLDRIGHPGESV
ncbi:hypothetical protein ACFVYD_05670 [Streptomyces sp. NPDC058301]|uniref:hypothetical protein n=1 Tax=Streptomyces sp. NPDC058301 TaxID=3346436 RepID=UPI0036EF024F